MPKAVCRLLQLRPLSVVALEKITLMRLVGQRWLIRTRCAGRLVARLPMRRRQYAFSWRGAIKRQLSVVPVISVLPLAFMVINLHRRLNLCVTTKGGNQKSLSSSSNGCLPCGIPKPSVSCEVEMERGKTMASGGRLLVIIGRTGDCATSCV